MSTTQKTPRSSTRRGYAYRIAGPLALLAAVASLPTEVSAQRAVPDAMVQSVVPAMAEDYPWMLGVNLASAAFGGVYPGTLGTHYGWPTAEDLDYHKARGMELIRLPFRWERVQRSFMGELWGPEMDRFDTFLDLAEERGMLVVVDMHNFGRYHIWDGKGTAAYTNYPGYVIGSPNVPRNAFANVWRRLAEHFKDRDCIWAYDIMNEPYNMGSYDWKTTAQVAINAIRGVDTDTMIMISGDSFSSATRWPTASGDLYQLVDPADNMIFQAHTYLDSRQSGEYPAGPDSYATEGGTPDRGVTLVTPFKNWLDQHVVSGFLGEFGIPDGDLRWAEPLQNMLTFLRDNNISGTYWAAGPRWGNYHLRSNIRANHDESPQMKAMLPFLEEAPGTGYWPPFAWYDASNYPGTARNIARGISGSAYFNDKSDGATLTANFQSTLSEAQFAGGRGGILLDYTVPADGWATAGMTVNEGVNLTANFARDHVLSLAVRSATGGSPDVYLVTLAGNESAKVNLGDYADLTDDQWHTVKIPLGEFTNEHFDGSQRVLSIAMDALPADNQAHRVMLNSFVIKRPDEVPPSTTVAIENDQTILTPGTTTAATATASDDQSEVDYVEFWVGNQRVAIDAEAPYTGDFTVAEAGNYRLYSIAYDTHGNSTRSAPVNVQVGNFGHLSWLGEFWGAHYEASGWIYHVDLRSWLYPVGDDTSNMWIWNDSAGAWFWSSESIFPYVYIDSAELTGWLYFGLSTPDAVWYYDFTAGKWISLP